MKYTFCLIVLASVILLNSCKEKSPSGTSGVSVSSPATTQETASQPTTTQQTNTTSSSTTSGLNPAHGQPGHRCEIPVGAPLNTAPGSSQGISTSIPPTGTTTPSVLPSSGLNTTTTSTGTGLNPAHGQPGHRCEIPVGAPLNSKPTQ